MSRIFRSEEVVKIAEAVMIPDCVVRTEPHSLPESTLIADNTENEEELVSSDMVEDDIVPEDEPVSEMYESEIEKLLSYSSF